MYLCPCGCGELFTGRQRCASSQQVGRAHERESSRRRRVKMGTTSQRGYGPDHQQLRKVAIARQPFCVDCGGNRDLCADHIVPTSKGGLNVLDNYTVRCRVCNTKRRNLNTVFV